MGASLQSVSRREAIWDEHAAIATAIAAGEAERAAELIGRHAHHASDSLRTRLATVTATTTTLS